MHAHMRVRTQLLPGPQAERKQEPTVTDLSSWDLLPDLSEDQESQTELSLVSFPNAGHQDTQMVSVEWEEGCPETNMASQ